MFLLDTNVRDRLITATALVHGLTVVPSPVGGFEASGVQRLYSWENP